jgi:glutathione S-transferase
MSTATLLLHTTPPVWRLPSISPACAKLETWFRMAGVEYEKPPLEFANAPKGKIPYVIEGERVIGDSTLIIEHLKQTRAIDLDRQLSPRDRAVSTAFRRMVKENLYWAVYTTRYTIPENWGHYRLLVGEILAPGAGAEVHEQIAAGIKAGIEAAAHGHGWGRHSLDEVALLTRQDLEALSAWLGDNSWIMGGDEPTILDATVFGYVGNLIGTPFEDAISAHARSLTNIVGLCERVRARYFPELVDASGH